ncbi:hypothetical protein P152DRAFT_18667 [Eremomyces bilateralis CBS 781.70]|uniref:Uncharacterized protein n=1 Tax=Eremomyces bilateralis CBS 781.70 TaxID=1392243 RepID=A0A6G1GHD7_9PEZI|nr:uncharacterized protein P152DRAFT_18667 [Eremomyces bilateralis CBS 781.70]KAF1817424.1 hypothetical protein P152DRAFT_18667 [Eremomyces bilateralis CBS 781.70]
MDYPVLVEREANRGRMSRSKERMKGKQREGVAVPFTGRRKERAESKNECSANERLNSEYEHCRRERLETKEVVTFISLTPFQPITGCQPSTRD